MSIGDFTIVHAIQNYFYIMEGSFIQFIVSVVTSGYNAAILRVAVAFNFADFWYMDRDDGQIALECGCNVNIVESDRIEE